MCLPPLCGQMCDTTPISIVPGNSKLCIIACNDAFVKYFFTFILYNNHHYVKTMSSKNCVSAITWGVFCMNESTIYPHCLVASCYKLASQRKVAPDWRCPVKVIALVLFAALEDLAQQRIGALGGWNAQSLVRRMHIMQLRPE